MSYQVEAEYLGDFSVHQNDTKKGIFGPFAELPEAERCVIALASQPAQHFWAIVGAKIISCQEAA